MEVHAMSYSLYSPIKVTMELVDPDGQSVQVEKSEPVYQGESGFVDYDTALVAKDLPDGDYYLSQTTSGQASTSRARQVLAQE